MVVIMNKKIVYQYSNGIIKEHSTYVKNKTILKESKGAKTCNIYEKNTKLETVCFGISENQKEYVTRTKFITTLSLK